MTIPDETIWGTDHWGSILPEPNEDHARSVAKASGAKLYRRQPHCEWVQVGEPDREFKGLTQEWASEPDKESPEAQWSMTETEFNRELENAREEGRSEARKEKDLELHYRLAALQQSVAFWGDNTSATSSKVVNVANTFETFLRDGKRI